MTKKNTISAASSRWFGGVALSALALVATQAHSQVVGTIDPGTSSSVDNGGITCADGETQGPILDGPTPPSSIGSVTNCADQTVTQPYSVDESNPAGPYYGLPATTTELGDASASFQTAVETTTVYDYSTDPVTILDGPDSTPPIPITDSVSTGYTYEAVTATIVTGLYESGVEVSGESITGTGSSYENDVNGSYTSREVTTGTSTFNPINGDVTYTPNAGRSSYADVDGLTFNTYDDVAETSNTTSLTAAGLTTDGSVNAPTVNTALVNGTGPGGSLTLHGGETSTTVVIDNAGIHVSDTTNGPTFNIDNTGAISSGFGAVTVNDDLAVSGNLAVAGATATHGIANTGNISNSGNYSTTNGNITTTNGTVTGAALVSTGTTSVGTNLTVGGNATVVGNYSTTAGNITTVNGRIGAGTVTINNGGSNKVSGLANATLSSTSTDAVTGQQLFATNNSLLALDDRVSDIREKAYQGVAMGFAANAAPLNLANGESGIAGGVGTFQGEWAAAIRAATVTDSGLGLGANIGFSSNAVGGAVGASYKF